MLANLAYLSIGTMDAALDIDCLTRAPVTLVDTRQHRIILGMHVFHVITAMISPYSSILPH